MNKKLKYVPVLRTRQQEDLVLKSFDFGESIYPCIEITKELDRLPPVLKRKGKKPAIPKPSKKFEEVYIPFIKSIKADKVFVDLPVHINYKGNDPARLNFFTTVIRSRTKRTEYMEKLAALSNQIIPVISTYAELTTERGSITLQEVKLRTTFKTLAFRTFRKTFDRDFPQIQAVIKETDYLIMDWEDIILDTTDGDQQEILLELKKLECTVVVLRNSFPPEITNAGLDHDKKVDRIDNSLLTTFKDFYGTVFSDYAGIKKDNLSSGGTISPGFIYYDAVKNEFYGFKFKYGTHKKGGIPPSLAEFEITIVPAIKACNATKRMVADRVDYLSGNNLGWTIINNISSGLESGKSAAKFKRIGIEHYLHCMKMKIENGDFDI